MPIITLTSDWNRQDYYLAAVKARLLSMVPAVEVVDISHSIPAFNLTQAAFLLRASWPHFPPHTVHLIGVNCESVPANHFLAVQFDSQYFLMADNGICGLLFPEDSIETLKIKTSQKSSFSALEVLVPAAVHLLKGGAFKELGEIWRDYKRLSAILPIVDEYVINGSVAYIDSYKNAITNISKELFDKVGKGKAFEILVQSNHYKITHLNTHYLETAQGELLALFNSLGYLEIAICNGNAADLMNLDTRSVVRVKFLK